MLPGDWAPGKVNKLCSKEGYDAMVGEKRELVLSAVDGFRKAETSLKSLNQCSSESKTDHFGVRNVRFGAQNFVSASEMAVSVADRIVLVAERAVSNAETVVTAISAFRSRNGRFAVKTIVSDADWARKQRGTKSVSSPC